MAVSCREKYTPRIASPVTGYLVVEGIINSGSGPTNILLSRTNKVSADSLQYENGAIVQVEGNDNSIYYLDDKGNGQYGSSQLNLNSARQYRLRIKTQEGKEYLSDFVAVKTTPPIDSVRWQYEDDGVHFFVNTHDPSNNSRYYYWKYEETWEFHSPYISTLRWDTIRTPEGPREYVASIDPDPAIYTCWGTASSTSIIIGSSEKLSEDIINNHVLFQIPHGSVKLSVLYSALIKQYALTSDAYEFLQRMKKNTEQTGSVFDAQPSALKGNIHSTSDASEQVIGYVSVSAEETRRIFIKKVEVPGWGYNSGCSKDTLVNDLVHEYWRVAAGMGLVPLEAYEQSGGVITTILVALPVCVDCTLSGTNKKPSFWP